MNGYISLLIECIFTKNNYCLSFASAHPLFYNTMYSYKILFQKTEIQNLKNRQDGGIQTNLAGDGKFDSRGLLFQMHNM